MLDCDLRKATVAKSLNSDDAPGMADVLRGQTAIAEAIRPTAYPNLFFVPAGHASEEEIGTLLHRPELGEVLAQLRRQYDHVLIDTPPVNVASDTCMLGAAVSDALLVIRMNKTPREGVGRAIRLLRAANVKVNGLVLTHQKYYIPKYLYRYS